MPVVVFMYMLVVAWHCGMTSEAVLIRRGLGREMAHALTGSDYMIQGLGFVSIDSQEKGKEKGAGRGPWVGRSACGDKVKTVALFLHLSALSNYLGK